jgi:hypothetical protein
VTLPVSVTVPPDDPTVTSAVAARDPPGPEHVRVNDVVVVSAPVVSEPARLLAPLQPPEAVQDVAFVEVQVNVVVPPTAMLVGFAVSVTVGKG